MRKYWQWSYLIRICLTGEFVTKGEGVFLRVGATADLRRETVRLDSVHLDPLYTSSESRPDIYNVTISCGNGLPTALCFRSIGSEHQFVRLMEASV